MLVASRKRKRQAYLITYPNNSGESSITYKGLVRKQTTKPLSFTALICQFESGASQECFSKYGGALGPWMELFWRLLRLSSAPILHTRIAKLNPMLLQ